MLKLAHGSKLPLELARALNFAVLRATTLRMDSRTREYLFEFGVHRIRNLHAL